MLKTCDKKRRLDDSNGSQQQQQPDESINGTGGKQLSHAESATSVDEASESSKQVMDVYVCHRTCTTLISCLDYFKILYLWTN